VLNRNNFRFLGNRFEENQWLTDFGGGRLSWLSYPGATRLIELLAELDPQDRDLLERRALPPWQRRACRRDRRDSAVRALAAVYLLTLPFPTGHELARCIAADCRRPPPADDPRRPLVDDILANSWRNRPPSFGTVRAALTGLSQRREPKPFARIVVGGHHGGWRECRGREPGQAARLLWFPASWWALYELWPRNSSRS
jgi:hypothetical protein